MINSAFGLLQGLPYLLQDDPPGVEPLQVDSRQEGIEDTGHHDDEGQRPAEAQQLIRFVLLCKRTNVEDQSRVSLPHLGI